MAALEAEKYLAAMEAEEVPAMGRAAAGAA
jgi:hypothetical protein